MEVIDMLDKETQYAPAQKVKVGNNTYVREDLVDKQITELKKQLEAKDKEIKELKDYTENTANLIDKLTEDSVSASRQLAIEVLEKLRSNIYDLNIGDYYLQNGGSFENIKVKRAEVYELIDNQIKELRGEKNEHQTKTNK